MHQCFVYKHNLPFFSVMYSVSHELHFHIKEDHTIIRILTLVRNPRRFWCEQEVVTSTAEFLVFYCPKQPGSTAKVTQQLHTSDLHQARRIWELVICLVIALAISYCLLTPRDFNRTVCSDLVRRCENSSEGVSLAREGRAEQRLPLSAPSRVPGLTAWQFQQLLSFCCSLTRQGMELCLVHSLRLQKNPCAFVRNKRRTVSQLM